MGDVKRLGDYVNELRIHYGPGCRVYFKRHAESIFLLLCGGVKKAQDAYLTHVNRLEREIGDDKLRRRLFADATPAGRVGD